MTNLRTTYQLFLDSKRIQIRTEFYVGPSFITVTGPTNLCLLPVFSLSKNYSRRFSLSLSAIIEGKAPSLRLPTPTVHCSTLSLFPSSPIINFCNNPLIIYSARTTTGVDTPLA